jgi:hypothetical protein
MAGLSISRADEQAYRQKKAQEAEERIRGLRKGLSPEPGPNQFGQHGNPTAAESGYLGKRPEQMLEGVPYDPKTGEYQWDIYDQIPRAEGRPYRIIEGHKYYPPQPFPEQETNPLKGVIPGRGPNAGKTPPLIIDNDWIRNFQGGYHDGPDNTPPGRIPLG